VNWLRAKAARDRWAEEVEILKVEFQWTAEFFNSQVSKWIERKGDAIHKKLDGHACYAARQASTFEQLKSHCEAEWQKTFRTT
jgi:hypothetical protein